MWEALYCPEYLADLEYICHCEAIDWNRLQGKTLLLSGATGQIGSCLVDAIMQKNNTESLNCHIIGLTRDADKAASRFPQWKNTAQLHFVACDVTCPDNDLWQLQADYILHLASNTHPIAYATDPIGTIKTNLWGTDNMLKLASDNPGSRFLLASSNEIYGENRGDTDYFEEDYCGYINCNTLRAGYPESKRCAEALCQAYQKQFGLCILIARLTRTYGPTLLDSDSKAMTQFLRNSVRGEDIVLKSKGDQMYSYTYVADAVTGLLCILTKGQDGEAYNIAEPKFDKNLREIAELIAYNCGRKVCFDLPGKEEAAGFSKVTKARLSNKKIQSLGWGADYSIEKGISRTLQVMKMFNCNR